MISAFKVAQRKLEMQNKIMINAARKRADRFMKRAEKAETQSEKKRMERIAIQTLELARKLSEQTEKKIRALDKLDKHY